MIKITDNFKFPDCKFCNNKTPRVLTNLLYVKEQEYFECKDCAAEFLYDFKSNKAIYYRVKSKRNEIAYSASFFITSNITIIDEIIYSSNCIQNKLLTVNHILNITPSNFEDFINNKLKLYQTFS